MECLQPATQHEHLTAESCASRWGVRNRSLSEQDVCQVQQGKGAPKGGGVALSMVLKSLELGTPRCAINTSNVNIVELQDHTKVHLSRRSNARQKCKVWRETQWCFSLGLQVRGHMPLTAVTVQDAFSLVVHES